MNQEQIGHIRELLASHLALIIADAQPSDKRDRLMEETKVIALTLIADRMCAISRDNALAVDNLA